MTFFTNYSVTRYSNSQFSAHGLFTCHRPKESEVRAEVTEGLRKVGGYTFEQRPRLRRN
mgnify:CR=1 FL=1